MLGCARSPQNSWQMLRSNGQVPVLCRPRPFGEGSAAAVTALHCLRGNILWPPWNSLDTTEGKCSRTCTGRCTERQRPPCVGGRRLRLEQSTPKPRYEAATSQDHGQDSGDLIMPSEVAQSTAAAGAAACGQLASAQAPNDTHSNAQHVIAKALLPRKGCGLSALAWQRNSCHRRANPPR